MRIGLHLYGHQLSPTANVAGAAWPGVALDPLRVADSGAEIDFLLLGGLAPGAVSGIGRADALIVPLAAAALAVTTPGVEIVLRLNGFAFDPAHVARIGGNMARLTRENWMLHLDGEGARWGTALDDAAAATRLREFVTVLRQHWSGAADMAGVHLRSRGRMVGPRPATSPPIVLDAAMAAQPALGDVELQAEAIGFDGLARHQGSRPLLVTCPVILGRSEAEAEAMARECRSMDRDCVLVGTPQAVAERIAATLKGRDVVRLALGFPALRIAEFGMARQGLLPLLRRAAA